MWNTQPIYYKINEIFAEDFCGNRFSKLALDFQETYNFSLAPPTIITCTKCISGDMKWFSENFTYIINGAWVDKNEFSYDLMAALLNKCLKENFINSMPT